MNRRDRAGVLVLVDGRLALIDRERPGVAPYSAIPGGGVEPGESFEDAAVREANEELGLDVVVRSSTPAFVVRSAEGEQQYFVADVAGGTFGTGQGREMVAPEPARGSYAPVLVTPEEAVRRRVAPIAVSEAVLRSFVTGSWPTDGVPLELDDPRLVPPVRVRAGGICISEEGLVLVHGGDWGRGLFYELPGGGVEEGETVEEAVVRELEEEDGLHVRIERELALVWKDGRREHYFLVRPEGASGRGSLDLEAGLAPAWLPVADLADAPVWPKRLAWRVADWWASGSWPDSPVELVDTILDLNPACRW